MYKKLFRTSALLLVIVISLLFVIAWAKAPEKKSPDHEEEYQAITYGLLSNPKTMDPATNIDSQAATVLVNAFEGLMTISKNQELIAGVAEQWEISKDGLDYTFQLRKNARWSDGKIVKASDFEYAWKRALSSELASENAYMLYPIKNAEKYHKGIVAEDMVGVKALGEHTLRVTLEERTDHFLSLTSSPAYFPLRKDMVEKGKKWEVNAKGYLVNGPYRMREWVPNELIVFEKNEHYWDADKVSLEVIEYEILTDREDYLDSFKAGNTDVVFVLPTNRESKTANEVIGEIQPHSSIIFFSINLSNEANDIDSEAAKVLRDVKVRQALSMSINRDHISQEFYKGRFISAFSFVPPGIIDYRGKNFAQTKFYEAASDVKKAKELLSEAGFPEGQGFPKLSILYISGGEEKLLLNSIISMWKKNLSIEVDLIEEKREDFEERVKSRDYLITVVDKDSEILSPEEYLSMWVTNSSENLGSYSSSVYDGTIENASKEEDIFLRFKYYKAAEKILMADMPMIPLFYKSNILYINESIKGAIGYPLGYVYFKGAYLIEE